MKIINLARRVSDTVQPILKVGFPKNFLAIFNWHQVTPFFNELVHHTHTWTELEHFKNEILNISNEYKILPLYDAINRLKKGSLTGRYAAFTFDDGDASLSTQVVPLLESLNLPATFFINTAYLEKQTSYWFPILSYFSSSINPEIRKVFPDRLRELGKQLRLSNNISVYRKIRLEIEQYCSFIPNLKTRLVSHKWLESLNCSQFTIGAHGHEHQRFSMMPIEWQRKDLLTNIDILSQYSAYRPLFAVPFGRQIDWNVNTFQVARELGLNFFCAEGKINRSIISYINRIPADGYRELRKEIAWEITKEKLFSNKTKSIQENKTYHIRHLLTGSTFQIGGIASVTNELIKLGEISNDFQISIDWINKNNSFDGNFRALTLRIKQKVNSLISRDPFLKPYRFPLINNDFIEDPELSGRTVLHVHKPSTWKQALKWKMQNRDVKLIFHAHCIDGFTGGCVIETDCPNLLKKCNSCPIVHSYARLLPEIGFRERAKLLEIANPIIIANSNSTLKAIMSSGIIPQTCPIEVITPSVDPNSFFINCSRKYKKKSKSEEIKIGFVSFSVENKNKGFKDFIDTIHILKESCSVLGYAAGNVQPQTVRNYPEVIFQGPITSTDSLREFYWNIDYLVIPSRSESFGLISIESQFCGTPVVAYDIGGLPETILNGTTGVIIIDKTPQGIANAIKQLKEYNLLISRNPFDLKIRTFLEKFETNHINLKWAEVYKNIFT